MSLRFVGGALKLTGARRAVFEMDTPALPPPTVAAEVPTAAAPAPEPEPAVVEVPTAAAPPPEPEPAVVEVPTAAPEPPA